MRFRLGVLIGGAAGYYFGAKAGHERYRQLNDLIGRARSSEVYETATEKAKAVVDLSVERARDLVDDAGNGEPSDFVSTPDPSPSGLR